MIGTRMVRQEDAVAGSDRGRRDDYLQGGAAAR